MLDIHCHALYGVDDGVQDIGETLEMLNAAKKCGIDKIVFTPHLYNTKQDLSKALNAYKELIKETDELNIKVKLGFEVNWNVVEEITAEQLEEYRIEGTDSLLIELPEEQLADDWRQTILLLSRYHNIIISHPERCSYIQFNRDTVKELIECGCEFAVDASDMTRGIFGDEWKTAHAIVKHGWANYIASDAHCAEHYNYFAKQSDAAENLKGILYNEALWL